MPPTLCGHLVLLAALSADPPDLPPSQVISPPPPSARGAIPEVTSATGSAPPFRFIPPLDLAAFGQRRGEAGTPTVTPGPGQLARLVLSGRLGRGGITTRWLLRAGAPPQQDELSIREVS